MATLDLGKIKFVWKGAYSGATTYEIDDVVSYQGSSYIYKFATSSSGNLPTNATYWDLLAQGSDLTILNTQGQILFRGASGLQALSPSTSGYILTTNGAGANPSWSAPTALVDQSSRISRFRHPSSGYGHNTNTGHHVVTLDGKVYHSGAVNTFGGTGSLTATVTGAAVVTGLNSVPYRPAVLPRGAKALKVFDFFDACYVIDTNGRLYATGDNTTGKLGLGMLANGAASTSTADVTARSKFHEVIFPTHDYPSTGSSNRPEIVHVFGSCQDNTVASGVVYAIDSNGFLWGWGNNTANSVLGAGTGLAAVIHNPIRIPTFMALGSCSVNSGINQPAATGTRRRIKKVTGIGSAAEMYCLVEQDDVNVASESGVWYWGTNTGAMGLGNNTAAYVSAPTQFSRGVLGLNTGEYVIDIIANDTAATAASGAITVLTSTGRLLTAGTNTAGILGQGNVTNVFGNFVAIPTTAIGAGLTWRIPSSTWTVPTGMTSSSFAVKWTPATYATQFESCFDTMWSFHGQSRYAQASNLAWAFWGTQGTAGAGAAGVGDLVAAKYSPTALSFRDSQHEDTADYRGSSDAFTSFQMTTGNVTPGFTIKKIITAGGPDNVLGTVVITSNDRVYVSGDNTYYQHGAGDAFVSTGFFRRVRIDAAMLQDGQVTISDARVIHGQGTSHFPGIQILLSSGEVYAWGYSVTGSNGLSVTTGLPTRVSYGAEVRAAV